MTTQIMAICAEDQPCSSMTIMTRTRWTSTLTPQTEVRLGRHGRPINRLLPQALAMRDQVTPVVADCLRSGEEVGI